MAEFEIEYKGADGSYLKAKGNMNDKELGTAIKEGSKALIEQRREIRQQQALTQQSPQPKLVGSSKIFDSK